MGFRRGVFGGDQASQGRFCLQPGTDGGREYLSYNLRCRYWVQTLFPFWPPEMKMRYRILILILLAVGGYYLYGEFVEWQDRPPVDTVQQEEADRVRDLIP